MSYELDNLKREIDSLKWQKAENYKLESLEQIVQTLKERIMDLANEYGWLNARILKLEQKELEREND
jgi:cupin superfamily acireductone dioxygenase involved in methionine salvage